MGRPGLAGGVQPVCVQAAVPAQSTVGRKILGLCHLLQGDIGQVTTFSRASVSRSVTWSCHGFQCLHWSTWDSAWLRASGDGSSLYCDCCCCSVPRAGVFSPLIQMMRRRPEDSQEFVTKAARWSRRFQSTFLLVSYFQLMFVVRVHCVLGLCSLPVSSALPDSSGPGAGQGMRDSGCAGAGWSLDRQPGRWGDSEEEPESVHGGAEQGEHWERVAGRVSGWVSLLGHMDTESLALTTLPGEVIALHHPLAGQPSSSNNFAVPQFPSSPTWRLTDGSHGAVGRIK